MVGLHKRGWTCGYTYKAIYVGTSLSIYKGALGRYKVYKSLHIKTSLIYLDLALYISFISSFSIFIIFYVYFQEHIISL